MKHDYLSNTPLKEALKLFLDAAKAENFTAGTETVPAGRSVGRITSAAVYAALSAPHYNACAMDGIAVKAQNTFGACENAPAVLKKEHYVTVDTGDPLPPRCDAVIMIEEVREQADGSMKLLRAVSPWENVRQVGEDLCMGDMIAHACTKITPQLAGAFLAGGVTEVSVKKKPVFGIIPTGDEIVPPTRTPAKGEIIEFNSTVFSAMLETWDAESKVYDIVKDDISLLLSAVTKAAAECDAILVLAGSSAGRDDYTATVCASLGQVLLHGVSIKPGKPVVLGTAAGKPLVGLPGYPVSAMVVMENFVRPLCALFYGTKNGAHETLSVVLTKRIVSSLKYEEFVRVTLGTVGDTCYAVPLPRGAGVITSVTKAGGILQIPQDLEGIDAGTTVSVRLLREKEEIRNTLVITGSHDPLIDEVADIINRRQEGFTVVSSHVGSMGALRAVGAGQAHMGACHLLDENTGAYNTAYVNKYFPDGGVVLTKGVGRVQGLMVAKGNPLQIGGIADLRRCRYVNRQRGAGTRVLFDYLLKQNGMQPADISGYGNEKFTHTAVAAAVAAGNADAGMGILSAARIYGLDFIPLCHEEYDFLINDAFLDDRKVQTFLEILRSEAFRRRLEEIGGYSV